MGVLTVILSAPSRLRKLGPLRTLACAEFDCELRHLSPQGALLAQIWRLFELKRAMPGQGLGVSLR